MKEANIDLWLIGAGNMGYEYAKVLLEQKINFLVISKGERNAALLKEKLGITVITGGLEKYLTNATQIPKYAIVATNIEIMTEMCNLLISHGVPNILLEKPGGLDLQDLKTVQNCLETRNSNVYIAYNRRFYCSVKKVLELIKLDGGLTSLRFEFTEWSHEIVKLPISKIAKESWLLANSSHVIDLAFFVGGQPIEMSSFTKGSLSWHSRGSIFSGSGITETGVLFSYSANWEGPGRWGLEFITRRHRFILQPIERLQIQKIGNLSSELVEIDYSIDEHFKPGLFHQTEEFLSHSDKVSLLSIEEQITHVENVYNVILTGNP